MIGLLQTLIDPLVCVASFLLILGIFAVEFTAPYKTAAAVIFLGALVVFEPPDLRRPQRSMGLWARGRGVAISWLILAGVLLFFGYATKHSEIFSRRVMLTWFVATPFVIIAVQEFLRALIAAFYRSPRNTRAVVIAVANHAGRRLGDEIVAHPSLGMELVGYFDDRSAERVGKLEHAPLLGKLADLASYCSQKYVDRIYIALPMAQQQRVVNFLDALKDTTASIYFIPDVYLFDLMHARVSEVNGIPVLGICESPLCGMNGFVKRCFDMVVSSLVLVLIFPLMLLIAIGVKLSSPGPVLFKQRRYGMDGREILIYKFRSMTVCEDGGNVTQATRGDKRVTPLGMFLRRTSLDELPQFINVLQGRMSVIGPRPHAVAHNEIYRKLISGYMIRHKVKPGISGWAQVNGFRGETASLDKMKSRVEYDLDYLRHWSLLFDLKILMRTVLLIFKDRNAY